MISHDEKMVFIQIKLISADRVGQYEMSVVDDIWSVRGSNSDHTGFCGVMWRAEWVAEFVSKSQLYWTRRETLPEQQTSHKAMVLRSADPRPVQVNQSQELSLSPQVRENPHLYTTYCSFSVGFQAALLNMPAVALKAI